MDSECLEMKGKDEKLCKVIRNIRNLDVSIQELEQQLKIITAESLDLQLKNCEELKNKLATEPPETETLAKNTERFLQLFAAEEKNEKASNKPCAKHNKQILCPKFQEENEPQESMSITTKEKQIPNLFTSDTRDSAKETNVDQSDSIVHLPDELNPYSIDEFSKKLLKALEDKLKKNTRRE